MVTKLQEFVIYCYVFRLFLARVVRDEEDDFLFMNHFRFDKTIKRTPNNMSSIPVAQLDHVVIIICTPTQIFVCVEFKRIGRSVIIRSSPTMLNYVGGL